MDCRVKPGNDEEKLGDDQPSKDPALAAPSHLWSDPRPRGKEKTTPWHSRI
jgi:hypothetical protein